MKRLKRGFIAFLIGEFFTLFKKDEEFKQGVLEKNGREKVKHILDGLFDFNKQLVDEAKEHFDTKKLEDQLHKGVVRVEKEYNSLENEVQLLKSKGTKLTSEVVMQLQERLDQFAYTALLVKQQISTFDVQQKINEFKKIIESLAKQAKKP